MDRVQDGRGNSGDLFRDTDLQGQHSAHATEPPRFERTRVGDRGSFGCGMGNSLVDHQRGCEEYDPAVRREFVRSGIDFHFGVGGGRGACVKKNVAARRS